MIMLTYFLNWKNYRTIKSGFLLDFFFKKLIYYFLKLQFIFYNNFVEKYYVEFLFLRLKDYFFFINNYVNSYSKEFAFSALSVFLMVVLVFVLIF